MKNTCTYNKNKKFTISLPIVKTESFPKEILEPKLVKISLDGTSVEYELLVKKIKNYHFLIS